MSLGSPNSKTKQKQTNKQTNTKTKTKQKTNKQTKNNKQTKHKKQQNKTATILPSISKLTPSLPQATTNLSLQQQPVLSRCES